MIQSSTKEVKIVPSEVTVKLLQQARQHSYNKRFIIDGFPRYEENRTAFDTIVGFEMISICSSLLSAAASITS
jgi:UMP-CMP kinase